MVSWEGIDDIAIKVSSACSSKKTADSMGPKLPEHDKPIIIPIRESLALFPGNFTKKVL